MYQVLAQTGIVFFINYVKPSICFFQNLSCLNHMEQLLLMTDIDLSQNRLRYLDDCNAFQCAKKICVDHNGLDFIVRHGALNLPCLEELSLNDNSILLQ